MGRGSGARVTEAETVGGADDTGVTFMLNESALGESTSMETDSSTAAMFAEVAVADAVAEAVAVAVAVVVAVKTAGDGDKSNLSQSSGTSDGDEILASCATGVAEKAADEVGRSRTSEVGVRSIAGEGVGTLLAKGSW